VIKPTLDADASERGGTVGASGARSFLLRTRLVATSGCSCSSVFSAAAVSPASVSSVSCAPTGLG
jgi:hypothetical protein